ncbi:MAG TPA: hypothetical protein VN844_25610 [Pyrinomonadaceae bacterium]|nr:hypothetical protein [Pyrinomonadaceae bacterium]
MKVVTKAVLSLCLVLGLGAMLTTNAQIDSDATIKVNIPHSFVVNNTTLPPGSYTIKVADDYSNLNVLEIRSANGKMNVLFDTEPLNLEREKRQSEVVFDKIGDSYFLAQVFLKGDESGNQVLKSKRQRRFEESGSVAERSSIGASMVKAVKQTAKKMK